MCKACETWGLLKSTASFDEFMKTHHCPVNHHGSAGSMEAFGVLPCFQRSTNGRKLRYTMYIRDGNTKAFSVFVEADPYPGFPVKKGECIGHIQKRVGTRLQNLIKNTGLFTDDKPLGAKSRLTKKDINKLQNYFDIAIRQNTDNLIDMKKAVGAVVNHCSQASDNDARHVLPQNCHYMVQI